MSPALIVLIALAGAFFVLIAFMILRALLTKPIEVQRGEYQPIKVNKERIAKKLSQAVQIPTLTVLDESMSYQPFLDFHNFLEKAFPKIHSIAQRTIINNYSLIYKIEGTDPSLKPGCFLAHQDVVPVGKFTS